MALNALVIDDDPEIVRVVKAILKSLNHGCESASDQESARELLGPGNFDYILLDLEIPVMPRSLCRVQNGRNLLREIRDTPGMEHVPIIVMTGHGHDSPDLAVAVMKDGAIDYVKKPFNGDQLDKAIEEALARGRKAAKERLIPFSAEPRTLTIHDDHITVCGVEVWRDCGQPDLLNLIKLLSNKRRGRYVRIKGADIDLHLERYASNPIARRIKDFRDRATLLLEAEGLRCGNQDIIASGGGGYHLTNWIQVEIADGADPEIQVTPYQPVKPENETPYEPEAQNETGNETAHETPEPAFEPQNDRQEWILEQLESGRKLRMRDILKHTKKNRSTINRDLKLLRMNGLIATHLDGYYIRSEPSMPAESSDDRR